MTTAPMPRGYCSDIFNHSQVIWPHDQTGTWQCPFDAPITTTPAWGPPPSPDQELPPHPDNTLPGEDPPVIDNTLPSEGPSSVPYQQVGSASYWDFGYPDEFLWTLFHDVERVAQEYRPWGAVLGGRAYTEEENARADAIAQANAVLEAQAALTRAVQVNSAPEELQALQEQILAGEGIEPGDPWRQPTGAHDAYPAGAIVSHNGKNWESTVAANVWEPGVSGWKDASGGIPEWVQPTGAHDAYNLGDVVTHNGLFWQSNINANVWEPPEQWTEIEEP